MNLKALKGDII